MNKNGMGDNSYIYRKEKNSAKQWRFVPVTMAFGIDSSSHDMEAC